MSLIHELKHEISRLSRKEIKQEMESVKRVNAKQREMIASLRKDLDSLVKEVSRLQKSDSNVSTPAAEEDTSSKGRITSKGIVSMRKKLDLTQIQFAQLAGVTQQTVVRWEKAGGKIPIKRAEIFDRLQEMKTMGKKNAKKALDEIPVSEKTVPVQDEVPVQTEAVKEEPAVQNEAESAPAES